MPMTFWLILLLFSGCGPRLPSGKMQSYLSEERKYVPAKTIGLAVNPSIMTQEKTIASLMRVPLSTLLIQWKNEHFQPNALDGTLAIWVEEAYIQEVPLKPKTGFFGFFPASEAKEKYVARVSLVFQYEHPRYVRSLPGRISVQTERTVPEECTIEDRRYLLSLLCEDLLMRITQETDLFLDKLFETLGRGP